MLTNLKINTVQRRKIAAVSAVLGMIIGIGITAAVGAGVYFAFQEQADLFSTSSSIEVKNMSVKRVGDELTITANVKNVGSTSISNMWINSISAGEQFKVEYVGDDDCDAAKCVAIKVGTPKALFGATPAFVDYDTDGDGSADSPQPTNLATLKYDLKSLSLGKEGNENLQGGSTQSIQITITFPELSSTPTPAVDSIEEAVQIAERIVLQLGYESGTDEFISDSYNTRVRPG